MTRRVRPKQETAVAEAAATVGANAIESSMHLEERERADVEEKERESGCGPLWKRERLSSEKSKNEIGIPHSPWSRPRED